MASPTGLDFVRQINPEGGAESTGLVTRFTMRRKPAPPGFPVPVRLLSQADVVKVIGNTFFSDCDLSEEDSPDAAAITALAEAARPSAGASPLPGLSEEDVWDIQNYFERQFKGQQIIRNLSAAGYWTVLSDLAPRVPAGHPGEAVRAAVGRGRGLLRALRQADRRARAARPSGRSLLPDRGPGGAGGRWFRAPPRQRHRRFDPAGAGRYGGTEARRARRGRHGGGAAPPGADRADRRAACHHARAPLGVPRQHRPCSTFPAPAAATTSRTCGPI